METWGVWDNFEDGFIDGPFTTEGAATLAATEYENVVDLEVVAYCPDHVNEEQPKIGCDLCF